MYAMESLKISQLVSLTLVYFVSWCTIFGQRPFVLEYPCAYKGVCECSEGTYTPIYTGIITIDCRNRNLTRVPALVGIPNFKYYRFILRDNYITLIESRDFRYNMFTEIDLGGSNGLIRIADKAFVPTNRYLKRLTLNVNHLNIYKLRFLHSVPKLLELTLESNGKGKQTTLPRRLFPGYKLKAMSKLTLTGFGITKIAWDAFLGVSNLKILRLTHNNLTFVPSVALRGLRDLSELDLSHNRFTTLQKNPFGQLNKLIKLDLSHNLFDSHEAIAPDAFTDLKRCLKTLIIVNSSLVTIPSQSLRNLKELSHLNLSDNRLETLANNSDPFKGNYKLRELDISGNTLNLSTELFGGLNLSLHRLIIRRMRLKELPRGLLAGFVQLHYLDMSNNLLKNLPADFNRGLHIRHYILKNMDIDNISGRAFVKPAQSAKLHVDLSSNRLTSVKFISETEPCTFHEVVLYNNPVLCDCFLYSVISDDTVNVHGRCSGGGVHFKNVSFSDHGLVDTLGRVCIVPESSIAPCRKLDALWRVHKQFSGVRSLWTNFHVATVFICSVGRFIF